MSTMNIPLPESLKSFVDEQVSQRGYGTSSESVRELLRRDQERQRLRNLLLAGAAPSPKAPADAGYFNSLRERVRNSAKARVQGQRPIRSARVNRPSEVWTTPWPAP
jgi:antitoxin ParD1/3/4